MMYIEKLKKLLLYAGLEKDEYERLLPDIFEENRVLLKVFSQLAFVMFLILLIMSLLYGSFTINNRPLYFVCTLEMLVVWLGSKYTLEKHPSYVMIFVYIFEIILFIFGIYVSILHAEKPAVSAIVFLLVSPLLFYDRPVRLSTMILAVVTIFCVLVVRVKEPSVAEGDVWNMISFGIVALAITVFIMSVKIRAIAQSKKIEYMSQTDLLTGVNNRNHYENRLQVYPKLFSTNLFCIFGDVNGLHEMNNKYGHHAGDIMLQEVASALREYFGQEHTYRIGGDEFVAFRVDGRLDELRSEMEQISRKLDSLGYCVSFGMAVFEKKENHDFDIYELIKEAEDNMYDAKREFYSQAANDRISR